MDDISENYTLICSRIEAICAYTEILFCDKTGDYLF